MTQRAWWRARRTAPTFLLSGVATGLLATMATTAVLAAFDTGFAAAAVDQVRVLGPVAAGAVMLELGTELSAFRHLRHPDMSDLRRSAILLRRDLWLPVQLRFLLGAAGGVVVPMAVAGGASASAIGAMAVAAVAGAGLHVAGELVERHHFFRVAVAPRMPGELH